MSQAFDVDRFCRDAIASYVRGGAPSANEVVVPRKSRRVTATISPEYFGDSFADHGRG